MAEIALEPSPSGEAEASAFPDLPQARGDWNPDKARVRIDRIARRLAVSWTAFLWVLIFLQGRRVGYHPHDFGRFIPLIPAFHLEESAFIAVVTTTTASVFGFLVIIANHLFKKQ